MSGLTMPLDATIAAEGDHLPWPLSRLTRDMARMRDDAWTEFHRRYFHRLFSYALKLHGGDHASAEDSVQCSFLRAVRNIRPFEDENSFWSWLTLLVRCAAADQGRKNSSRQRTLQSLEWMISQRSIQSEFSTNSALVLLDEALCSFSEDDRVLLDEKYSIGHSTVQLAESRGMTCKAIECRLRRLRKKLKSKINALNRQTA